jgi:hypothetical protein
MAEAATKLDRVRRAIDLALTATPESYVAYAEAKRRAHPDDTPRELAERIVRTYAEKGALEGFVTGLAGNPLLALGGGLADVALLLRFYTTLTAVTGYLADESYFADPDWRHNAFFVLAGPKVVARMLGDVAREGGKQIARHVVRASAKKEIVVAFDRFLIKWFGKKLTERTVLAKGVPLVGGVVGGAWNYAEIRLIGKRIVAYHFDGALA